MATFPLMNLNTFSKLTGSRYMNEIQELGKFHENLTLNIDYFMLSVSPKYNHFIHQRKKTKENNVEKGEIAQNKQFHILP